MCSLYQSVTLNLSGKKKNLRGEPPSAPGALGVGREKKKERAREPRNKGLGEGEENHNGVAFQGA